MSDTILVVEDELALRETLVHRLKNEGYTVASASDGRSAVDAARSLKPDLILLDLMLPEMDGFEVCRILRKEMITPILMLAARLFAVVDVFDALTSDRPYREAWEKEKALVYIQEQSGRHFFPDAVDAFIKMIQGKCAS